MENRNIKITIKVIDEIHCSTDCPLFYGKQSVKNQYCGVDTTLLKKHNTMYLRTAECRDSEI